MSDSRLIDCLSSNCETLHIQHNAHRETQTTVARHLLHRERLGDAIIFTSTASRVRCMESETLWEVSIGNGNGTQTHVAGASLDECLDLARTMLRSTTLAAIAA